VATLYYNAAVNTTWNNVLNWWQDAGFSVPAGVIPANGDTAYIEGNVNTGPTVAVALAALLVSQSTSNGIMGKLGAGITSVDNVIVGDTGSGNYGVWKAADPGVEVDFFAASYLVSTGGAYAGFVVTAVFNDSSYNIHTVTTATFNDSSYNSGSVTTATFNDSSFNGGVTVTTATFNDSSFNGGSVITATFNDNSLNYGYATTATFNDSSFNGSGGTVSTATFVDSRNIGTGTITTGTLTVLATTLNLSPSQTIVLPTSPDLLGSSLI